MSRTTSHCCTKNEGVKTLNKFDQTTSKHCDDCCENCTHDVLHFYVSVFCIEKGRATLLGFYILLPVKCIRLPQDEREREREND